MKTFWKILLGSTLGFFLALLILIIFGVASIGSIAGSALEKGPSLPSGEYILKIDFNTPVTEQSDGSLHLTAGAAGDISASMNGSISVYSMVKAIEKAATDPQIRMIYMTPDDPSFAMSAATAEEVRAALKRFREAGKAIVSYSNQLTGEGYYMASVADRILFNAYGDPMIFGMSSQVVFFKDALDKLGIDMQLIRHGKYKAAGEQFTKSGMTPENREQNQAVIDAIWSSWADEISVSRGFTADEFNDWLDNLELKNAQSLLDKGLVDELCYQSDVDDYMCSICEVGTVEDLKVADITTYAKAKVRDPLGSKSKIAVVYANGEIMVDTPTDRNISGVEMANILAEIRRDSTIKAVVLRVNSPGGAAQGAEMINHELGLLKAVKPVVASYGDYAASGGYWISARADRIFCDKATLTGSIGVFSLVPAFGDALKQKVGINMVAVNSNRHSDLLTMMREFDSEETAYMESTVEKVYNDFTAIVAEGRNMPADKVDEVGQGRVWAGVDAIRVGLVDECGGLVDAIRYAEELAGLSESGYKTVEYPAVKSPYEKLMENISSTSVSVRTAAEATSSPISAFDAAYSSLKNETGFKTMARMPYIYKIY